MTSMPMSLRRAVRNRELVSVRSGVSGRRLPGHGQIESRFTLRDKVQALIKPLGSIGGKHVQLERPAGGGCFRLEASDQRRTDAAALPCRQEGNIDEQDFSCAVICHKPADGHSAGEDDLRGGCWKLSGVRLLLGAELELQEGGGLRSIPLAQRQFVGAGGGVEFEEEFLIIRDGGPQANHGGDHAGSAATDAMAGSSALRSHLCMWG